MNLLSEVHDAIGPVFCDVLERSAFMFGDENAQDDLPPLADESHLVTMAFHGPFSGEVSLAAPVCMCRELAANALGADEDEVEEAHALDALKELVNVTCGRLLTALAGEEPAFALTPPVARPCHGEIWSAMSRSEHTYAFNVDGYPVLLRVELTDAPVSEAV